MVRKIFEMLAWSSLILCALISLMLEDTEFIGYGVIEYWAFSFLGDEISCLVGKKDKVEKI